VTEPSRRTEFDRRYKGGFWAASRIETQDKVAAIVGVEALGGNLELVPCDLTSKGGRLAFEAREDFEIRWNGGRQYVSVKDQQVDRSDLRKAITKLDTLRQEVGSRIQINHFFDLARPSTFLWCSSSHREIRA
jgi:hypothetical protein